MTAALVIVSVLFLCAVACIFYLWRRQPIDVQEAHDEDAAETAAEAGQLARGNEQLAADAQQEVADADAEHESSTAAQVDTVQKFIAGAIVLVFVSVSLAQPVPNLPPFEHPAKLADELLVPKGPPPVVEADGRVCYTTVAHRRLATVISAVKPTSDVRAGKAWNWGYIHGREVRQPAVDHARSRAAKAEQELDGTTWKLFWATLGAFGAGAGVGVVLSR